MFFFSSRRRHTRYWRDWSSDVCSSDLTLYAEGQRRYIESLSTYAKQFLDRMPKPQVDRLEGLAPAVAIEQRNPVVSSRSTVGTATEVYDYLRLLWSRVGRCYCRLCGGPVRRDTAESACGDTLAGASGP